MSSQVHVAPMAPVRVPTFVASGYFICIFTYFFFNAAPHRIGMPLGLLITTAMSPLIYFWLLAIGERKIITRFALFTAPFVVAHFYLGVVNILYLRSWII